MRKGPKHSSQFKPPAIGRLDRLLDALCGTRKRSRRTSIVLVTSLLGLGFVAVVVADVMRGTLNLERYLMVVGAFLSGLGIRLRQTH
jgi:hypothetical protein